MKKPRNPYVALLHDPIFRQRVVENNEFTKDAWSRKAKHPKKREEEIENNDEGENPTIQLGDNIEYQGKEGIVKVPQGPQDMVGIAVDGEYLLVDASDIKVIEESIARMVQLSEQKYFEITSGMRIPVSQEEQDILDKCKSELPKSELDERDQEVSRRMVSRGLLKRHTRDGKIYFTKECEKLRRD